MKCCAIVQARMGSTRLPGKALRLLAGKPVIWHVLHRLQGAKEINEVVLATTVDPADDALAEFAAKAGFAVTRGPADDVLARYVQAARTHAADIIVRVTGDAPLVDPRMVDAMVQRLLQDRAEWCVFEPGVPCLHEGFSPFTRASLERLFATHGEDAVAREHVTGYFAQHPEFVRTTWLEVPERHRIDARLSIDTPADLAFFEALYQRLGCAAGDASCDEVAEILRNDAAVAAINRHVQRKGLDTTRRLVLIRCDASPALGTGHVVRCIALAVALRDHETAGVAFVMRPESILRELVQQAGFPVHDASDGLARLATRERASHVVLDIRDDTAPGELESLRAAGVLVALIDDASERRLHADYVFAPPVPAVTGADFSTAPQAPFMGWRWVMLREAFSRPTHPAANDGPLLVAMGGTDPTGMAARVIDALTQGANPPPLCLLIGPTCANRDALDQAIAKYPSRVEKIENTSTVADCMDRARAGIVAFGMTAYEMAARGRAAVHICLTDDHVASSKALAATGAALCLGHHAQVSDEDIRAGVMQILAEATARGARAREVIDGRGAERAARVLCGATHFGCTLDKHGEFEVIDCESCGYRHVHPMPDAQSLRHLYQEDFYATDKPLYLERHEEDRAFWELTFDERLEVVEQLTGKTGRAIDVGCGPGIFLDVARARGWEALGIEPSTAAARHVAQRGHKVICDFFSDEIARQSTPADMIHLGHVLEHIPEPGKLLSRVRQTLAPGGVALIVVPNDYSALQASAKAALGKPPWWVAPPHHLNYFDRKSLEALASAAGLLPRIVETSFPMELFLLMGKDYVGDDALGRSCHNMRKTLEQNLERSGHRQIKRELYRAFATQGLGRDVVLYATRGTT